MSLHEFPLSQAEPEGLRWRDLAAALLRAASRSLDRLALRLALREEREEAEPWLEFHAEAGAPEGAVYVNGRLMGHLPGVSRL
jgi:hypothetical protein